MKTEQIVNWLENHSTAKEVDVEVSGMSKSNYISFTNDDEDILKIRISDHKLPISYNRDFQFDVRFDDSWTDFKKELLSHGIKKAVAHIKAVVLFTDEEITFLKSEYEKLDNSIVRLCGAYGITGKKREQLEGIL